MIQLEDHDLRDIAFCGHAAAGKTELLDAILYRTHAVNHHGHVADGSSVCDFDAQEKQHRHTIESKIVHFDRGRTRFFALDTPGYPDLIGQTIGALHGVDSAAVVVDAHTGVLPNTRRVFETAGALGLGRILIVNKLDQENGSFERLLESIREAFGPECLPLTVPLGLGTKFRGVANVLQPTGDLRDAALNIGDWGQNLLDSLVETDDEVLERYLEGQKPSDEELRTLWAKAVRMGRVVPILCVSAKTEVGLDELLDMLPWCCLPPEAVARDTVAADGHHELLSPDPSGRLVARVIKTRIDPFVQKLSYVRVFSGTLKKDDVVHVSGESRSVKIPSMFLVQADKMEPTDVALPGQIVAIPKLEELHNGRTLGDFELPAISYPQPMVGLAVAPKSRNDEAKLSSALHKLVEEDPTVHIDRDPQTKELVLTGMSELHLRIVQERLAKRDKVEVETHEPKIPYRETILAPAEGSYRHKKQSGGRGQFGEVHIRMHPMPRDVDPEVFVAEQFPHRRAHHWHSGHRFLWVDSISQGTIPNNFLPAIEKGFLERLDQGVVAGYPIEGVCVEVFYGKHHDVDSSEAAFKIAGSHVFRDVFKKASPTLLEPIVTLHVTIPVEAVGEVTGDLSSRRGRPVGMDSSGSWQTIHAEIPLSETAAYDRVLSSLTGGRGEYALEFSHYEAAPYHVQQKIVQSAKKMEEED